MLQNFGFTRPTLSLRKQRNWLKSLSFIIAVRIADKGYNQFSFFSAFCPLTCKSNETLCPSPYDENDNPSGPGSCVPRVMKGPEGQDCPAVCTATCKSKEKFCSTKPESNGCPTQGQCVPKDSKFSTFHDDDKCCIRKLCEYCRYTKSLSPLGFLQCCQLGLHFGN